VTPMATPMATPMLTPILTRSGEVTGVLGAHVDRLAAALPVLRAATRGELG
jgi:D-sedoheptulose 7-phosphate isomerase